ncbi:hypothetical protein FRB94_009835 [Tulasnella sp. JGI-2019a]|nr:hypothetical protein FRB94_009835 [Tulasnella sp. JGI-2019a]KAG9000492.1 hypothetical protein FRB93_012697 [Tulasnella sp. JGI-2019a]KAG9033110.1 hypothetical protein FRB95_000528 [Tulasnella sp. JGI-2019a]
MADKEKMSRALGTAFLTHQVAQLEKEVFSSDRVIYNGRGGGSGRGGNGAGKRGRGGGRGGRIQFPTDHQQHQRQRLDADNDGYTRERRMPETKQVAERLVIDASVLIHALGKVREWSRDDRKEIVVIPLEALNTLDLLKKGTSQIAVRARQASRFLEAQVGVNPRMVVQFDDGYTPWEKFNSNAASHTVTNGLDNDSERTSSDEQRSSSDLPRSRLPGTLSNRVRNANEPEPPEWLKRTICCAKYEAVQTTPTSLDASSNVDPPLKAPIAICCIPGSDDRTQGGRFENRASGVLTKTWAVKVGLEVLDVTPEMKRDHIRSGDSMNADDVVDAGNDRVDNTPTPAITLMSRPLDHRRQFSAASGESQSESPIPWNKNSNGHNGQRKASFGQTSPLRSGRGGPPTHGGHLVEKPVMPIPLTKAGLLPAGKVIRLLARGEKLDP